MAHTYTPYARLPDPVSQPGFYADVPLKRLIAFFIDVVIIAVLSTLIAIATLGLGAILFFGIGGFLYRVLTIAQGSATWGMRFMGIELLRHDGERFTFLDALIHTASFYISFAMAPAQLISVAMMAFTQRGQGLTDMLFGTVAVNRTAKR
ncbi:MAG: RDD family protein [Pseudomonadota bacterium]